MRVVNLWVCDAWMQLVSSNSCHWHTRWILDICYSEHISISWLVQWHYCHCSQATPVVLQPPEHSDPNSESYKYKMLSPHKYTEGPPISLSSPIMLAMVVRINAPRGAHWFHQYNKRTSYSGGPAPNGILFSINQIPPKKKVNN